MDFALQVPGGYKQQDLAPPEREIQTSRAPPQSPLRARFDAPAGGATISVVVKGAQTIKPSLFQVRARELLPLRAQCTAGGSSCRRCARLRSQKNPARLTLRAPPPALPPAFPPPPPR